jgi:lipid II:glycine glycyltransferase (peptidoglycan interpeptide bridge formation enzyme)
MSNKDLYIKIAEGRKDIPLFLKPWWLDVVCEDWDVAIARKGDQVAGVWPYPLEKKLGVGIIRNPKLTPYLGPKVFLPADIKERNADGYEHETVAELMKQLPEAKVWHLALQPGMKQAGLFKNKKLSTQVQQTFLLELKEDEATLLSNMKDSTRRNIRMAEDEVTISNETQYLRNLYGFQKQTLQKKGKQAGYPFKYLQKIMEACIAHDSARLWVAKEGKKIQAIVWQVWDEERSYYFMGGQNPETNSYRAMSLLLWHMIREAKKRGHKTFDLEGSMDEGVERFFRNFGGDRALYMVLKKNSSIRWKVKQAIFK